MQLLGIFNIASNQLRISAPVDRESQLFAQYLVPQIQVKLNLVCLEALKFSSPQQNVSLFSETLVGDEIPFSRTVTLLNLIIDDENDNVPIFTQPSVEMSHLGYPDVDLANKVMPPYLIKVEAFDIDEGINAKIKFSLQWTEDFVIDEDTGIIYASKTCMLDKETTSLMIIATDRNGGAGGNVQGASITVVKISAENVVTLTLSQQRLTDVEEVIKQIATVSEIDMRTISFYAYATNQEVEGKQMNSDTKITVFAYAFNSSVNVLMTSEEILQILDTFELSDVVSFAAFTASPFNSGCNLTGLVVAVSILGGLLLLISIGTPLLWFLWLRYKIKGSSRRNSETSAKKLEEEFSDESGGRSSPVAVIEERNENDDRQTDAEIIGIEIQGATEGKNHVFWES